MRRLKNILVNVIYTIFYAVSLNYNSSFSLHSPFVTNHRSKKKIVFFFLIHYVTKEKLYIYFLILVVGRYTTADVYKI